MAKAQSLEKSFEKLDEIIQNMENGDLQLEEAFKMYQEGIKIVEGCNCLLDKVEKKIVLINENGEKVETDGEF